MKILFMGTPDFAAVSLRALLQNGFDVVGVFTQPDKPVGRKQILQKPETKLVAEEYGIPVFQPTKLRDGSAMEIIKSLEPDLIAVVAYGRLLPDDFLSYPKYGCINIHGSILPKYRGSAPIQWAVIKGEAETGVTSMYMAHDMDAGDIIEIRKTPILPDETAGELFDRLAVIGGELLCDTVRNIADGNVTSTPQNHDEATFAPPLTKEMANIDWNCEPGAIISLINGLNPWPIAIAEIRGERYKVYKAVASDDNSGKPCGEVISAGKDGLAVACSGGSIIIKELQAPGGKRMAAADYLRGHPICP